MFDPDAKFQDKHGHYYSIPELLEKLEADVIEKLDTFHDLVISFLSRTPWESTMSPLINSQHASKEATVKQYFKDAKGRWQASILNQQNI